jgi:hypothetical protein
LRTQGCHTREAISFIGGTSMDPITRSRRRPARREILKSSALAILPLALPSGNFSFLDQQPMTANGGKDPYPIPWLDKNGSHNQPAGPNLEPSHIYHFKGRAARSSTSTGMGIGHRQSGKPHRVWQRNHRLRRHAGRLLGWSRNATRYFHTRMTDLVPGTGGPCKPDP